VTAKRNSSTDQGKRLWLVDDSRRFRQLYAAMLSPHGLAPCRDFDSAEQVLAALEHEPGPELLLLDVNLPGLNGATAVKLIKQLSPLTRVFMISSLLDADRMAEARAGGASGFIIKVASLSQVAKVLDANAEWQFLAANAGESHSRSGPFGQSPSP
jgi:DNA-binding NtrC family response regulator